MSDTFEAGFEFVRLLGKQEFRDMVHRIRQADGIIIAVYKTTPIDEVVNLMFKAQVPGKKILLVVVDETLPAGADLIQIGQIESF